MFACFDTVGAEFDTSTTHKARPLKVRLYAALAGGIIFSGTYTV